MNTTEPVERPPIDLSPSRVMCDRHGQPFRHKWPSGYPGFVLFLFEELVQLQEIQDVTGGDVERIPALLDLRPMCCRLPPDRLLSVYYRVNEMFHTWVFGRCRVCRKRGTIGGPYQIAPGGRLKALQHLCLRCVVYALESK